MLYPSDLEARHRDVLALLATGPAIAVSIAGRSQWRHRRRPRGPLPEKALATLIGGGLVGLAKLTVAATGRGYAIARLTPDGRAMWRRIKPAYGATQRRAA